VQVQRFEVSKCQNKTTKPRTPGLITSRKNTTMNKLRLGCGNTDEHFPFNFAIPPKTDSPHTKGSNLPKSQIPKVKWRVSWSAKDPNKSDFERLVIAEFNKDALSSTDIIRTRKPHIHFTLHQMFLDDLYIVI